MSFTLRKATPGDARTLADLANIAAEGMPFAYWQSQSLLGEDPLDIGEERFRQLDGVFSWRRATVAEVDGEIVGMILAHATDEVPSEIDEGVHPMFRPLVRLSQTASYAHSVNTVAVYPKFRRQKVATALMSEIEREAGFHKDIVLITSDANAEAHAFTSRLAYQKVGEAPVIKGDWDTNAKSWQLLRKLN